VRGWRTEANEPAPTNGGSVRGRSVGVHASARACAKCENDYVSARGGGRGGALNVRRREGSVHGDRDKRLRRADYADINVEPKAPEGGSAGSVCRMEKGDAHGSGDM